MAGKLKSNGEVHGHRLGALLKVNIYLTAAVLAVTGLLMLCASTGSNMLFRRPDALLGLSNRTMLVILGVLHVGLGGWLLATRDLTSQGLMTLWLGANCLVYRLGMTWVKVASPIPLVKLVAQKLGASPRGVDICWKALILYLVVGSLAHLVLERRRLKLDEDAAFLKRWKVSREQAAVELPGGRKVTRL